MVARLGGSGVGVGVGGSGVGVLFIIFNDIFFWNDNFLLFFFKVKGNFGFITLPSEYFLVLFGL